MSETFNIDFRKGSLIEKYTRDKGTNVGNYIVQSDKGLVYRAEQGNSGQITYTNKTALNFGALPFSVVCAFKMGEFINVGSIYNNLFASGTYSNNGGISFLYSSSQQLQIAWEDGAGDVITLALDDFGNLNDGKYHLAILTFDGTTYKAFLDNVQETTTSTDTKNITSAQTFNIGRDGTTARRSNSDISFIRAYNHELTASERGKLQDEFNSSHQTAKTKRNFVKAKPTDLSNEVENTLIEKLINGTFDDGTNGWTETNATFSVSDGIAEIDITGSGGGIIQSPILNPVIGRKYIISTRYKMGTFNADMGISFGGTIGAANITLPYSTTYTNHTEIITATSADDDFYVLRKTSNTGTFFIEEISCKEFTGLVAAYNMVPNGSTLVDISGEGNNGTITGAISTKDGMAFDGVDDFIGMSTLATPANLTISTWVNYDSLIDFAGLVTFGTTYIRKEDNGKFRCVLGGLTDTGIDSTTSPAVNQWYNVVLTYDGSFIRLYVNGSLEGADASTGTLTAFNTNDIGKWSANFTNGKFGETRIYNRALSTQEVKDYYNSFSEITLLEGFEDSGADGVAKTPREFVSGTGTYVVGEHNIKGSANYRSDFSAGVDSWTGTNGTASAPETALTVTEALKLTVTAEADAYLQYNLPFQQNKTMRLSFDYYIPAAQTLSSFLVGNILTDAEVIKGSRTCSTTGSWVYKEIDYILTSSSPRNFRFTTTDEDIGDTFYLKNVVTYEIPPLRGFDNGTKYLENSSAGTIAIPSKQSYGSWEWDVFKGADGNNIDIKFIGSNNLGFSLDSNNYFIQLPSSERVGLFKGSAGSTLFATPVSYIAINTWYRMKVTRTKAGAFTVYIRGGAFGDDDWTLVSVAGGSGSNPVTDTTYTTSNYMVIDNDAGDRISRIKLKNGVKQ